MSNQSAPFGSLQAMATRIAPWFLHQEHISAFLESVGLVLDGSLESLRQGARFAYPLLCDRSALPAIARDRQIRIYPSESEASQRYRLAHWEELHRQRGCHYGQMLHLQPYFLPDVPKIRIVHQAGDGSSATWHTLDESRAYSVHRSTPSNWDYDGHPEKWSRYWAIVYIPARYLSVPKWDGGGAYDGGSVYGGLSTQVALDIVQMVKEWGRTGTRLQAVILATDPDSFYPPAEPEEIEDGTTTLPMGNWGSSLDSTGAQRRRPDAIWIYDRGTG